MKLVARLIFALSLALAARADGYVQNLDAKPIVLPCGLKFGEMYKGAVKSARSNYVNGREYKRYEAVITNSWCSFDEFTIMLTGKKRIGTRPAAASERSR